MRKCRKCGARNDDEAVTCSLCNERLAAGATDEASYEPRMWKDGKQRSRAPGADSSEPGTGRYAMPDQAAMAKGPPADGANTVRHFLLAALGAATPLDTARGSLTFGRDEACDFKLPSTKVSRRHAEVLFSKADRAYIRDLSSQNGTFVNDQKLSNERGLEDGDVVRMGDIAVTYRKLAPGEDVSKLTVKASETAIMEAVGSGKADEGKLSGDIAMFPIGDVLRRLAAIRAHGTLNVDVNGNKGSLRVVDGRVAEGSYAGLEGPAAVTALSSLSKGQFSFAYDPTAPKPSPAGPPAAAPARPPAPRPGPPSTAAPRPPGGPPGMPRRPSPPGG
jgi:pSer/pThr/pTyr-binding forkhead associated (FHA) protein